MSYVFTSTDFISRLKKAQASSTLYVNGAFGAPAMFKNKLRYTQSGKVSKSRRDKIFATKEDTFFFDCVCLIKGILWGWKGDKDLVYGGAVYQSNSVPDLSIQNIVKICTGVSTNFSDITEGEFVWLSDYSHCGVYVGDGMCIECTPKWEDGVLYSALDNEPFDSNYNKQKRKWYAHGKLPWINYSGMPLPHLLLVVDGWWGRETTLRTQEFFRTTQDGVISSQANSDKIYLPNASVSSWQFKTKPTGSTAIKHLQNMVGAKIDGFCGNNTITQLQKYLLKNYGYSLTVSGTLDSDTVKAYQAYLNNAQMYY